MGFTGISGLIYLLGFLIFYDSVSLPVDLIFFIFLAGLLIVLAFITQNLAVQQGKGGLAIAVVQTQNFMMLALEVLIEGRLPSASELVSLTFGVIGSSVIALARG
jgi:drug/metabolite transporter (DMT)-like permease